MWSEQAIRRAPVLVAALFVWAAAGCSDEGARSAAAPDSGLAPEAIELTDAGPEPTPDEGSALPDEARPEPDLFAPEDLPACEPACDGLDCGDDGCGGFCGECEAGEACKLGVCKPPPTCPPEPPFGNAVSDVLPDVALEDCEGTVHHLHGLCEREVSLFILFSGS